MQASTAGSRNVGWSTYTDFFKAGGTGIFMLMLFYTVMAMVSHVCIIYQAFDIFFVPPHVASLIKKKIIIHVVMHFAICVICHINIFSGNFICCLPNTIYILPIKIQFTNC